jgi:membrane associated rhomboid family serine protease
MIYLKCHCGNGLGVPGSFTGETVPCEDCGRCLRLVAGRDLEEGEPVRWCLEVLRAPAGVAAGEQILLGGDAPIEVGKADGKHLLLPGTLVSRGHCRLVPDDDFDGWRVEDTNSRNGLFVNGERATSHSLQPGDVITIGEYELVYAPAGRPAPAGAASIPPPLPERAYDADDEPDAEYELAEAAPPPPLKPLAAAFVAGSRLAPAMVDPTKALGPGPTCPCCRKTLAHGAKICVDCGVDAKSGRPLLIAQGLDEDFLQVRAENVISVISWVIPFGLYPVASEARGNSKPYAVWTIAALTVLVSFVFFGYMWSAPEGQQPPGANLMLWAGDTHADEEADSFERELRLQMQEEIRQLEQKRDGFSRRLAAEMREQLADAPPPPLEFHAYQLFTHALLHGDLMHIAGNMLFLLVFGTRVNALLGNLKTAIVYPVLAVAGGIGHLVAQRHHPASPMLGASGAIMGLAGMYLVLFPVYRVHMAIWLRLGFLGGLRLALATGFRVSWKLFAIRGFWVVLFYIAFDVLATALGAEDGVAHWAHLGGFIAGMAIALLLILTRLVNACGGDILSVTLGRYAWPLLGRPGGNAAQSAPALTSQAA